MSHPHKKAGALPAFLLLALLGSLTGALFNANNLFASEVSESIPVDHDWNVINASIAQKKFSLAEKQIGNYIKFHPKNHRAYILGARIARKIHQPERGIAILDKGIDQYPDDKTFLRLKAELLMEQGNMSSSRKILGRLSKDPTLSHEEKEKVSEDRKTLEVLVLSAPPLETFDQNINFQEPIPPPFQSPSTYELENSEDHIHIQNIDIGYAGGSSIGTGITAETPLLKDTVHFQAGTNLYVGSASGQTGGIESYLFAGVDGQG
ncbi:conserved hypothetical protein, secreted, partial [mine drainage metagenome]